MIPSSGRKGVTLIEAIISLMIITILASVLMSSQGYALRSGISTMYEQIILRALQRRFIEINKDRLDAREKAITSDLPAEGPKGTIVFTARRPAAGSSLYAFENLYVETVTAHWNDRGRAITTELVRYRVYPQGTL
jgi:prepilin-type N-terminal cleavage/methylation domain-containing protein